MLLCFVFVFLDCFIISSTSGILILIYGTGMCNAEGPLLILPGTSIRPTFKQPVSIPQELHFNPDDQKKMKIVNVISLYKCKVILINPLLHHGINLPILQILASGSFTFTYSRIHPCIITRRKQTFYTLSSRPQMGSAFMIRDSCVKLSATNRKNQGAFFE